MRSQAINLDTWQFDYGKSETIYDGDQQRGRIFEQENDVIKKGMP